MQRLFLAFGLIQAVISVSLCAGHSQATTKIVPDDFPTIQAAVDSDPDTVLVRAGTYPEHVSLAKFNRNVEFVLRTHPEAKTRPRVERMTVVQYGSPFSFAGLHFTGGIYIHTTGDKEGMTFDHCRLDSGLVHYVGDISDLDPFRVSHCTIRGDVRATPFGAYFESDTLIGGGIIIDGEGGLQVNRCVFNGPGRTAIEAQFTTGAGYNVLNNNLITGYDRGIYVISTDGSSRSDIASNTIMHCSGWGIFADGEATVRQNKVQGCAGGIDVQSDYPVVVGDNEVRDCGAGIRVGLTSVEVRVIGNRVLRSGSTGLSVQIAYGVGGRVAVERNVVGRSGGDGVVMIGPSDTGVSVQSNTSYLNGGSGFVQRDESGMVSMAFIRNIAYENKRFGLEVAAADGVTLSCNDWYGNALGPANGTTGPSDLSVDPKFCDTALDSVHLYSDSPLLNAPGCGLVGALGQGCLAETTPTLVSLLQAEPRAEGIELRWRLAPGSAAQEITVERSSTAKSPWSLVVTDRREDQGTTLALDRSVEPERTYWYRLQVTTTEGRRLTLGPLSATAGARISSFALSSNTPNPRLGPVRIEFLVAREGPVRLSVVDIQGRELAVLADGMRRPGNHLVDWNGESRGGPLTPGLYFVRYQAEARSWVKRLAITR